MIAKRMKQILTIIAAGLMLAECSPDGGSRPPFTLHGAWVLQQKKSPEGYIFLYLANEETKLLLYEGDSMMYSCQMRQTAQGLVMASEEMGNVTLISKGGGKYIYLEGEEPRPLTVVNDSTITIQRSGMLYTWLRADDIEQKWGTDIRETIAADLKNDTIGSERRCYVFSDKERRLTNYLVWLLAAMAVGVVLTGIIIKMYVSNHRLARRLQQQLLQLKKNHEQMAAPVKQAVETMEDELFDSDDYLNLQQRIATGQRLKDDEWNDIETLLTKVYPSFTSQLRNLYPMSELEYRTCLLVKLRIAPGDIAAVLSRDISTISTVRSRLYKKVFGEKGGTREWDEFVHSNGT